MVAEAAQHSCGKAVYYWKPASHHTIVIVVVFIIIIIISITITFFAAGR